MRLEVQRRQLEELYTRYNHRRFVHPDPLEFLYRYSDDCDREIVGLVASSLAFGRVAQILKSVSFVLDRMPSPSCFLRQASLASLRSAFGAFQYRFIDGEDLCRMLLGVKGVIERYGSLYACFLSGLREEDDTVLPALTAFVKELSATSGGQRNYLLPSPTDGSACKRLNLFVRWMARCDEIDPGGWEGVPRSKLVVPLDTHMHKISVALGMTKRRQADRRTAVEITKAFRTVSPADPVRYDFALTRLGIRRDPAIGTFLGERSAGKAA